MLFHGCYQVLGELLLPCLKESRVVVEVALHGLIGSDGVIVGEVEKDSLEVQLFGRGSSQLALHVFVCDVLEDLFQWVPTLMSSP